MNKNPKQHINIKQMNETACVCERQSVRKRERRLNRQRNSMSLGKKFTKECYF